MQPVVQSTSETPEGPLTLRVYPGKDCQGTLYLDDGHTFAYKQGQYLRQSFTCTTTGKSTTLHFAAREGTYTPWWHQIEVVLYNSPSAKATATLGSTTLKTTHDPQSQTLHITIPDQPKGTDLQIK